MTFAPTYNLSNRVSGLGSHVPTYDADGNNTWDTVNTYSWDSDGNMIKAVTSSATTNVTYDAMDRAVGGAYIAQFAMCATQESRHGVHGQE